MPTYATLRVGRCALVLLILAAATDCSEPTRPNPPARPLNAPRTSVQLVGDADDYVLGGATYTYTQANAVIAITARGGRLSVSVNGDENWIGEFQLPNGVSQLEPGTYAKLGGYPFSDSTGGLSWSGLGRGCDAGIGSLTIDAVTYVAGTLTSIDLRFEQHCDSSEAAAYGTISYRADDPTQPPGPVLPIPPDLWRPPSGALPASGNYVYLQSDAGEHVVGTTTLYTQRADTISATWRGGIVVLEAGRYRGYFQVMKSLARLERGYYGSLQRYPFSNPTKGGLAWSGNGRGCNELRGWFAVDSVSYVDSTLVALDLRFEQHCDGQLPALHGAVHWRA